MIRRRPRGRRRVHRRHAEETPWQTERRSSRRSRSCSTRRPSSRRRSSPSTRVVTDESIYEQAEADSEGFWAEQAEALHWFEKWDQVLDWSDPPYAKWFAGGKLNVAYNCVDRHVEAGNGDRVAFHWRGEEGEERDVTYADLHRDVQSFANALKDHGIGKGDVVGIFLPMIPEVAVAMLACARIGAIHNVVFGGFSAESVKERMEFSEAKALITVDGARRKGKTAPIKEQVDEVMGDVKSIETIFVVKRTDNDAPMTEGRDVWYHEALEAADDECEAEPLRRRAPAVHPLLVGLDGQAEGHPAHDRRLPDAASPTRTASSSTSSPRRTSTGARPTSAGSPGTPTSSTGRSPTAARRSCTRARPTTRTRTSGGRSSSATTSRSSTPRRPRSARA